MSFRVIKVIDEFTVVINAGENANIKTGETIMLYGIETEPTIDPFSKEELGKLKYPKGKGKVIDVQGKMSIIRSEKFKIIKRKEKVDPSPYSQLVNPFSKNYKVIEYDTEERIPFNSPEIGDYAELN